MEETPKTYVRQEDGSIIEKEPPVIEHKCWWCSNPFMWEIHKPGVYILDELVYYHCCSCGAYSDQYDKTFRAGKGPRKE